MERTIAWPKQPREVTAEVRLELGSSQHTLLAQANLSSHFFLRYIEDATVGLMHVDWVGPTQSQTARGMPVMRKWELG